MGVRFCNPFNLLAKRNRRNKHRFLIQQICCGLPRLIEDGTAAAAVNMCRHRAKKPCEEEETNTVVWCAVTKDLFWMLKSWQLFVIFPSLFSKVFSGFMGSIRLNFLNRDQIHQLQIIWGPQVYKIQTFNKL